MKFVANPRDAEIGDILITKNIAGELCSVSGNGGCDGCVMAKHDARECYRVKAVIGCTVRMRYLTPALPDEAIERARDLFALKGELL